MDMHSVTVIFLNLVTNNVVFQAKVVNFTLLTVDFFMPRLRTSTNKIKKVGGLQLKNLFAGFCCFMFTVYIAKC